MIESRPTVVQYLQLLWNFVTKFRATGFVCMHVRLNVSWWFVGAGFCPTGLGGRMRRMCEEPTVTLWVMAGPLLTACTPWTLMTPPMLSERGTMCCPADVDNDWCRRRVSLRSWHHFRCILCRDEAEHSESWKIVAEVTITESLQCSSYISCWMNCTAVLNWLDNDGRYTTRRQIKMYILNKYFSPVSLIWSWWYLRSPGSWGDKKFILTDWRAKILQAGTNIFWFWFSDR